MSKDSKSAAAAAAAAPKANLSKAEAEAKAAAEKEEQAAAKAADKAKREELEAAVAKFEPAKFDEIARFMQKHKYFERSVRLAPLHVLISRPNNVFSSVRQYFSGKVLRKIIASKEFKEKFRLEFTRPQADILLLAMQNTAAKKPDLKKNLQRRYFIQVEAAPGDTKVNLRPCQISTNEIKPSEPYVWVFQGSLLWRHVLLGTVITIFLLLCLYPVWPDFMKLGVWYLSVTLLLFLFTFFLARGVIFLVLWIAGFNFWILPNILDDDLPPIESFKPLYSWEPHAKSRSGWMYRISVGIVLFAMTYWVYVQPNAYHAEMLSEQRSFVDDLYSGKFLSDRSEAASDNLDEVIPDYEELLQEELAEGNQELTAEEQAEKDILDEILKEDADLYADDDEDDE